MKRSLLNHQKKKLQAEKERNAKYMEYKLNAMVEIIDNLPAKQERYVLFKDFDTYLFRKRLFDIGSQIIKGIKEIKEVLYNFLNNYWHHLLDPIKNYQEFYKTAL